MKRIARRTNLCAAKLSAGRFCEVFSMLLKVNFYNLISNSSFLNVNLFTVRFALIFLFCKRTVIVIKSGHLILFSKHATEIKA